VKAFEAMSKLAPLDAGMRQLLAQHLRALGRAEEAVAEFRASIALGASNMAWVELGDLLRARGRADGAATGFRDLPKRAPRQSWEGLAAALLDQGRFAEARTAAERMPVQHAAAKRRLVELCDSLRAIEADLPAILAGKKRPADAPTRLAVAHWCLR